MKEFLAVRGIAFQSVNVLEDDGLAQLRALGARSVPIVAKGEKFVFAQVIKDVVEFLELTEDTAPELSPAELMARYEGVMSAAIANTRQMPNESLQKVLPNRPRSYRVLMHHAFQIPTEFLDALAEKRPLEYEKLVGPPPADMVTSEDIASFGDAVQARFVEWWAGHGHSLDYSKPFEAYFGTTTLHEMLERTVWHSTQHVRQVQDLLAREGVEPEMPLGPEAIEKLPLTEKIWDE